MGFDRVKVWVLIGIGLRFVFCQGLDRILIGFG